MTDNVPIFEALQKAVGEMPIWYWVPASSVGDVTEFIIYSDQSSENYEADDLTFYRTKVWQVMFYSESASKDIAPDLETYLKTPVTQRSKYNDPVANKFVTVYTFEK